MSAVPQSSAFLYVAVRSGGGRKFGLRQAGSTAALAQSLRAENQLLLKTWKLPGWAAKESELGLKDQATLNEQLAQLLSRGVPLVEALDVASQTVRPQVRPRILRMKEQVAAGSSFADACKTVGGFDNVTIAVYRGAERSGDLAGSAKELFHNARRRLQVVGKATTLMIYPAIVLSISLIVASLIMIVIVPMLSGALEQQGIKLPSYSRVIMGTGKWMRDNVLWLGLGVAIVLTLALIGREIVVAIVQRLMRRLPMIREVVLAQESARFFSVMAAMTRTGVPVGDALGVANQAVTHPVMRKQLERLRTRLIEGGLLRALIEEVTSLPLATRRLLIAAERAGDLESAFGTLAGDMIDEVEKRSGRLLAMLEPALIVFMFAIIGSLLLALMLPILTMARNVGS